MLEIPKVFGVLAGTVGGDYTDSECHDYCIWVIGVNIGWQYQVCNPSLGAGIQL